MIQPLLEAIADSTRPLSGESISGCAQVSFDPSGELIVVTERAAQPAALNQQTSAKERLDDEGVIITYEVDDNGLLNSGQMFDATGQGPFGFTFTKSGVLLTTEQFDGPGGAGRGGAASYILNQDGSAGMATLMDGSMDGTLSNLLRSSPSEANLGTDTCWFVASDNEQVGFTTSFFGDGRISAYRLDHLGIERIQQVVATGPDSINDNVLMGASDLSLSRDSTYLYQLNSVHGTVSAFQINYEDGSLTFIDMYEAFPQPEFGPGGGEAAPMGLSAS